eukprot:SAG11_NODE_10064_length_859_cov_1.357895_1_plen_145_part_00
MGAVEVRGSIRDVQIPAVVVLTVVCALSEPNGANFWKPKPNASAYAALAVALGMAIQADPALKDEVLVGPAAAGGPPSTDATNRVDLGFIKAVKEAGGLRFFDAISVHPYCFGGESNLNSMDVLVILTSNPIRLKNGRFNNSNA